MALIKCPECGRQISDKAASCPSCGCPIANAPTTVKIRCLSNDRTVRYHIFMSDGRELGRGLIGSTVTLNITRPTRITVQQQYAILRSGDTGSFTAVPGKCYEARFVKPGLVFWQTDVSEVSFIG